MGVELSCRRISHRTLTENRYPGFPYATILERGPMAARTSRLKELSLATNVEFKARLRDLERAHATAQRVSGCPPELIRQIDMFFRCDHGRLKLRILDDTHGELIAYERNDETGPRRSSYDVVTTENPQALLKALQRALTPIGCVKKRRSLYRIGQSRIHIDEVESLGSFLEIEVALPENQPEVEGRRLAEGLLLELEINDSDLVADAYIDLLVKGLIA
jgi:predicted adenylyl cyclase CyaB